MLNLAKHVPWHMVLTSRVLGTARLRMAGPFVCATLPEDVATACLCKTRVVRVSAIFVSYYTIEILHIAYSSS